MINLARSSMYGISKKSIQKFDTKMNELKATAKKTKNLNEG